MSGCRIRTMRPDAPKVNRVIRKDGGVTLVRPFDMADEPPDYVVTVFVKEHILDSAIAFYVREGEQITVGMLMEALGPDWVVESLL